MIQPEEYGREKSFYDQWSLNQGRDWLFMNPRQRGAVAAALGGLGGGPNRHTLEFGAGIGACGELFVREAGGKVVSLDLSSELLATGRQLFGSENHEYFEGTILDYASKTDDTFNQILLIDVLEHIRRPDWGALFAAFKDVLEPDGQIFISTPTPGFQEYLRKYNPAGLQPVDLSIDRTEIENIAQTIGLQLVRFEEVSIFREYDYQYFWLAPTHSPYQPVQLRRDNLVYRHKLLLSKWPGLYVQAFSAKLLWAHIKRVLRGERLIVNLKSLEAE